MKIARLLSAATLALGSLFFVSPVQADPLQDALATAQANLAAGQQAVADATQADLTADARVEAASISLRDAQANYETAHAAYLASAVNHEATTTTRPAENVVLNGDFHDASAWSGIVMYQDSMYNNSSVAVVRNNALWGSYSAGNFYYQQGNFASPVRTVTFAVDVWDNNNQRSNTQYDYYRIEFRTYSANGTRLNYYNLEYSGAWHDWITRTATYNLSADAVRWDVGFRLQDGGYWNGNYGPAVRNVSVMAATTTTTPAYTSYGEAETLANTVASTAVNFAQTEYNAAVADASVTQAELDAAIAALPALEQAVADAQAAIDAENARLAAVAAQAEADRLAAEQAAISEAARLAAEEAARLAAQTPPWWAQQNWEGETVTITAPDGWEFASVRAWYGSPTDQNCGVDVSSVLGALMIGQHSVTVALDNGTFGDPCGGVVKVTRLTWSVVQSTPTVTPSPEATPTETPTAEPTVAPTETPTPVATPTETPTPEPSVTQTPTPEPTPTPTPGPAPEPPTTTPDPGPVDIRPTEPPVQEVTPTPVPVDPVPVTPTPEPTPTPTDTPTPVPSDTPIVEPTPTPTPTTSEEPTVAPTVPPTQEPTPAPSQSQEPAPVPSQEVTVPPAAPEPSSSTKESVAAITALVSIDPQEMTTAQVEQLVSAAETVLASTPEGSPAYEKALDALAVAAQADDPQVPEALANIPGVGQAAAAVLGAFNTLGNLGADMSPAHRETAKKEVVAAIVLTQVTTAAIGAATSAATSATSSSSGSAARRREGK